MNSLSPEDSIFYNKVYYTQTVVVDPINKTQYLVNQKVGFIALDTFQDINQSRNSPKSKIITNPPHPPQVTKKSDQKKESPESKKRTQDKGSPYPPKKIMKDDEEEPLIVCGCNPGDGVA